MKPHKIKDVDNISVILGTDPECFIYQSNTGNILNAESFFNHLGMIASDGTLLEFRPLCSFSEYTLTENIRSLIRRAKELLDEQTPPGAVCMRAASCLNGIGAGFHIHFGIPHLLKANLYKDDTLNVLHSMCEDVAVWLDACVAIPLTVFENSDQCGRRTSVMSPYGRPSDIRYNTYNIKTLEYRVLGGHVLRHPMLVLSTMTLCSCLFNFYLDMLFERTNGFDINKMRRLYSKHPKVLSDALIQIPIDYIQSAILSRSSKTAKRLLTTAEMNYRRMGERYRGKKRQIDWLFHTIDSKEHLRMSGDMWKNWRIIDA